MIFVQFLHWSVTIFLNFHLPNIIHVHCIMLYVHGIYLQMYVIVRIYKCFYKLFSNTQINAKHIAQIVSNLFRRNQVYNHIFYILPNIFNICTSNFCQTFLLLFSAGPNESTIGFWKITWGEISQNRNFLVHTLTLFYTRGLEIVVLHVMVSQPYRFSPCLFT